jgi:hypothetical protein
MKKSILLMFVLLMISCESSNDAVNQESLEIKQALSVIEKKGFDSKNYQVLELPYGQNQNLEKMISIENDLLFLVKDLLDPARDKQYSTTNILKPSVAGNLRIALKTSGANAISNEWKIAFQAAIANWNSVKTSFYGYTSYLTLQEVNMADGYDILVYSYNLFNPNVIAQAGFPTNTGDAFSSIYINTGLVGSLSNAERVFTATHEMGHSLGFRHTNWFDRNSDGVSDTSDPYDYEGITIYGANHIPNTPTGLDPNSIMNAFVSPWSNFSQYDKQSVRYLYPKFNIIFREFIEYNFYIYKGWPILKFKVSVPKGDPDPQPAKKFSWFYKESHKRNSSWIQMREQIRSEGELRLPRDYSGKIEFIAVAGEKEVFSSKVIEINR